LLHYDTTTQFPGNWRGTAYGFVLHWKKQVMRYEKLELEDFHPNQKLRMLQNSVGDVTELAFVKQISYQDVARGNQPLAYEVYMELLLPACSTYDKQAEAQYMHWQFPMVVTTTHTRIIRMKSHPGRHQHQRHLSARFQCKSL
jgi:hypothetical protein